MGVIKLFSPCSDDSHQEKVSGTVTHYHHHKRKVGQEMRVVGNPNPLNFQILRYEVVGRFVVVLVRYPECLNYEGEKILVFENVSVETIKKLKSIDPHFCSYDTHTSPVARFVPTRKGWEYAIQFCKTA